MGDRVAVVGAGYAGMAAAVTLAERGIPLTVFESGPVPGGRARRVLSQGYSIDNGQHVLIGAHTELYRLTRLVGVRQDVLLGLPLEVRYAKDFSFRALWFTAPFGLLAGLLAARGVPFSERIGAVRFMLALQKTAFRLGQDVSFNQLLKTHRQDGAIGHYLWRPLCVSALNTPAARASAQVVLSLLPYTPPRVRVP